MPSFTKVATLGEVPEDTGKLVEVDGTPIALFKQGDEILAIDSLCPHQGGPLNEGGLNEGNVICPWHGWEFSLKTGECSFNDAIKVATYKVKVEGEDILVEV